MFNLKPIERDAVARALEKAERYRLLNEPREAESICRDVLAVDPSNQAAAVCLILALTDLFAGGEVRADDVRPLAGSLKTEFERRYYAGVIEERWAKTLLAGGYEASLAFRFVRDAMQHFDSAQSIAPEANDDAVLRWNACVRMIERYGLAEDEHHAHEESLDDDVPMR
jgi:hypothetical protein